MARSNSTSLAFAEEQTVKDCFEEVKTCLSSEGGYWLEHDIWTASSGKFAERGIDLDGLHGDIIADFSMMPGGKLKTEMKYHVLWSLDMRVISARTSSAGSLPVCKASSESASMSFRLYDVLRRHHSTTTR